ncbi:MAG: DUF370 domain-containing protein [Clostridia bacterium]|nr:DUF370 domain-containing protein [Clostridia bacterium]
MYLFLGGDVVIDSEEVVAVLEGESIARSSAVRQFMKAAARDKKVVDLSDGNAKAVVVTTKLIYLCPVAPPTICGRCSGSPDFGEDGTA